MMHIWGNKIFFLKVKQFYTFANGSTVTVLTFITVLTLAIEAAFSFSAEKLNRTEATRGRPLALYTASPYLFSNLSTMALICISIDFNKT